MEERKEYPAGVPCWVDLEVPDPDASAAFYGAVLGWSSVSRAPEGVPFRYLVQQLDGLDVAAIGSSSGDDRSPAWTTWVAVDDADASVALVRGHGGSVVHEPADIPGAGRSALCTDPTGATFGLWEAHGTAGAQLVNAPGSWNWSSLGTADPTRAMAFYTAVFGWVGRPVDLGDGRTSTMLCRPGYAEFLAVLDPGLPERHAAAGVPEGFSDAIGWVDEVDGPPGWAVTFAVADADAVAERCAAAGGVVVSPPMEAGPTRLAVLQDPHGATFTASHYRG